MWQTTPEYGNTKISDMTYKQGLYLINMQSPTLNWIPLLVYDVKVGLNRFAAGVGVGRRRHFVIFFPRKCFVKCARDNRQGYSTSGEPVHDYVPVTLASVFDKLSRAQTLSDAAHLKRYRYSVQPRAGKNGTRDSESSCDRGRIRRWQRPLRRGGIRRYTRVGYSGGAQQVCGRFGSVIRGSEQMVATHVPTPVGAETRDASRK